MVSHDDCKESYSNVNRVVLTRDQLCAGRGDTDTCAGDSGGPMLSDARGSVWSVIGVTSYGVECGSARQVTHRKHNKSLYKIFKRQKLFSA